MRASGHTACQKTHPLPLEANAFIFTRAERAAYPAEMTPQATRAPALPEGPVLLSSAFS